MKPEVFWQFHRSVEGIRDACMALNVPVTGGNVSFYNENPEGAIYPTPTIGVAGVLEDIDFRIPSFFQKQGDAIFLVGETFNELGGSHYLMIQHEIKKGLPPRLDLEREKRLYQFIWQANEQKLIHSCHDLSEGGLAVALFESCLGGGGGDFVNSHSKSGGAVVDSLDWISSAEAKSSFRPDAVLFGETQSRVLISAKDDSEEKLRKIAQEFHLFIAKIGTVGGRKLKIGKWVDMDREELENLYTGTLRQKVEQL